MTYTNVNHLFFSFEAVRAATVNTSSSQPDPLTQTITMSSTPIGETASSAVTASKKRKVEDVSDAEESDEGSKKRAKVAIEGTIVTKLGTINKLKASFLKVGHFHIVSRQNDDLSPPS
jgi:hypothetical protein